MDPRVCWTVEELAQAAGLTDAGATTCDSAGLPLAVPRVATRQYAEGGTEGGIGDGAALGAHACASAQGAVGTFAAAPETLRQVRQLVRQLSAQLKRPASPQSSEAEHADAGHWCSRQLAQARVAF